MLLTYSKFCAILRLTYKGVLAIMKTNGIITTNAARTKLNGTAVLLAMIVLLAILAGCTVAPLPPAEYVTDVVYSFDSKTGLYSGGWLDGKPQGEGVYVYTETDVENSETITYKGEWNNGLRSGQGVMTWTDGTSYDGEFANDEFNGYGVYIGLDGTVSEGNFKDGTSDGDSVYTYTNGDVYDIVYKKGEIVSMTKRTGAQSNVDVSARPTTPTVAPLPPGEYVTDVEYSYETRTGTYSGGWLDGKPQGEGVYVYTKTDIENSETLTYEGEWNNGLRSGQGVLTYVNGDNYDGGWFEDDFDGYGVYTQVNDFTYEGDLENGQWNGHGVMTWANSDKYEGEFVNDSFNGYGIYVWANGDKYEGDWVNDAKSGYGVYMGTVDGKTFIWEGEYKNDALNGQGTFTSLSDEEKYEGTWKDGAPDGQGVYHYAGIQGIVYEGEFEGGLRNGKGVMSAIDGSKYDGDWKDDKREGDAVMTYPGGKEYDVVYKNNVLSSIVPRDGTQAGTDIPSGGIVPPSSGGLGVGAHSTSLEIIRKVREYYALTLNGEEPDYAEYEGVMQIWSFTATTGVNYNNTIVEPNENTAALVFEKALHTLFTTDLKGKDVEATIDLYDFPDGYIEYVTSKS
jgi:hypothetical protein